jgi:signal transduction histidine kinase
MTDLVSPPEERARRAAELALIDRVDRSLRQATERLAQTTNVRGVITDMLRESSIIVDAQGVIECGLLLYDSASRLLHFEAMFANGVATDLKGTPLQGPFSVDSEPLALPWLRIQQEPWLWGLTDDASILATTARAWHESKGSRSVAYLPLRRGQDCIGFVGFSLKSGHPPTPQQVDLLQSIGSQVALAVEVERLATANEQASVARERQRLAELRSSELTKANLALQATIDAVTSMQSLDDFMPRVVAIVAQAFEAVGAGYFECPDETIHHRFWLEDGQLLAATELADLDPIHLPTLERLARGFSVPPEHLGIAHRQRLRPSIIHHRVATASPALHALAVSRGWDWELNIPLFANARSDAAITFFRHEDTPFTEADVSLAESLAKQISLARQVSRVGEREREITVARERAAELARANQVMSRVNDLMSSEINPESALKHVLRELTMLVSADAAALYEFQPGERRLRFKMACERGFITNHLIGHPYGHADSPWSIEDFPAWPVLERDRRHLFIEIGPDQAIPPSNAWHVANGHKMLALAALLVGGDPVGLLGLAFTDDAPLSDSRREMFGALAQQMTLALQLVHLADQARATAVSTEREQAVVRERERMSRDIHDTLAQGYAAILVHSQALKPSLRSQVPPSVLSSIEMFERLAKENLAHARRTMEDLRADPFARTGLTITLQECATESTTPGVFSVAVETPGQELWVPRYVEVELRRIVKEALINARRHARTGDALVRWGVENRRCTICIIDRGVGFDAQMVEEAFGIRGMRERAARAGADLAIETSLGHGTSISITIDVDTSDNRNRT